MVRTAFDGQEIANALLSYDYRIVDRKGSHLKLRLDRDDLTETRNVTVPLTSRDNIGTSTFRSIADQCGADDYHEWCRWIDDNC